MVVVVVVLEFLILLRIAVKCVGNAIKTNNVVS